MTPLTTPHTHYDLHIVRQVPYKCEIQKDWVPLPAIHFRVKGKEGIKLIDAINLCFGGLDGRDDLMFTQGGIGNSVSCRLYVCGFRGGDYIVAQSPTCLISSMGTAHGTNRDRYVQLISLRSARGLNGYHH